MHALERLLAIMKTLRDPQKGCSWDRQQTYTSLAPYTLEESYEVLDAIQRSDFIELRDELGDLLLQIVFYAQIASEEKRFDFDDICHAVSDKMERRHPHIFADAADESSRDRILSWERSKSAERAEKDQYSVLDDIPDALPALMKADKIQKRCRVVGFDWDSLDSVVAKVYEELDEVLEEVRQNDVNQDKLEEEIGDLLFATVNLSRHMGKKAETALQSANRKFERRFRQVEKIIASQGVAMSDAAPEQLESAWQQVKSAE